VLGSCLPPSCDLNNRRQSTSIASTPRWSGGPLPRLASSLTPTLMRDWELSSSTSRSHQPDRRCVAFLYLCTHGPTPWLWDGRNSPPGSEEWRETEIKYVRGAGAMADTHSASSWAARPPASPASSPPAPTTSLAVHPALPQGSRRRAHLGGCTMLLFSEPGEEDDLVNICRRFETGGSLGRRVKCRRVPQPRWVGARPSAKGGSEVAGDGRERGGNPAAFVFVPRPGRVHLQ
jgi:hypothetical protein